MSQGKTILAQRLFFAWCQLWLGNHVASGQPAATPYPTTTAGQPVSVPPPPYLQPSPVLQPVPPVAPVYPPQSTAVPLPSHTPGSIFGPPAAQPSPNPWGPAPVAMPIPVAVPQPPAIVPGLANPIAVPVIDEELAWDQIADVVSDYFPIAREQRARRGGEVSIEGRIETAPQDGATWLEPHRGDSVGTFNRWESTFQTIRRRAVVRVVPDAAGYLVEVIVEKELEDLPSPELATAGAATFGTDGALPSRRLEQVSRTRSAPRWIQLGRDPPLEQRMLADIHARLAGVAMQRSVFAQ